MSNPKTVAEQDQQDAATRDAAAITANLISQATQNNPSPNKPFHLVATPEKSDLIDQALMRCKVCPHLAPKWDRPHIAELNSRLIVCMECRAHIKESINGSTTPVGGNGRCRWCDRKTALQGVHLIQLGPMVMIGNACTRCAQVLKENPHQ